MFEQVIVTREGSIFPYPSTSELRTIPFHIFYYNTFEPKSSFLCLRHTHEPEWHPFTVSIHISDHDDHISFFLEDGMSIFEDFSERFQKMIGIFCIREIILSICELDDIKIRWMHEGKIDSVDISMLRIFWIFSSVSSDPLSHTPKCVWIFFDVMSHLARSMRDSWISIPMIFLSSSSHSIAVVALPRNGS